MTTKTRKHAMPSIWGGYFGLGAAAIATVAGLSGQLVAPHNVYTYAGAGFAWGWTMAHVWNWTSRW